MVGKKISGGRKMPMLASRKIRISGKAFRARANQLPVAIFGYGASRSISSLEGIKKLFQLHGVLRESMSKGNCGAGGSTLLLTKRLGSGALWPKRAAFLRNA